MAKINVRIPKQCEDDEIITIETPILPCCMMMTHLLMERNDAVRYDQQSGHGLLRIDNGYWIGMNHCPYCGKTIETADFKKKKQRKTEKYEFIEYSPLRSSSISKKG